MAMSPAGVHRYRDAVRVLEILQSAGFEARLAGGCVRDRILGVEPVDYDVATSALPPEALDVFAQAGLRTVPTGLAHGTVTVVTRSGPVEVTTLRVDLQTDGRHAEVAFGTSFEEDAARRDFTINAMFEDARGQIFDFVGGRADLAQQRLRFVGDPADRIHEDYLRILRLFRFWSRLGFSPVDGTLEAVAYSKDGLRQVSQERVTAELLGTFAGLYLAGPLAGIVTTGVWPIVLPELVQAEAAVTAARLVQDLSKVESRLGLVILGALILFEGTLIPSAIDQLALRLRLSNGDRRALSMLCQAVTRLLNMGNELADNLAFVDLCDEDGGQGAFGTVVVPLVRALSRRGYEPATRVLARLDHVERVELAYGARRLSKPPANGADLMRATGIGPGEELGRLVNDLRRAYRNGEVTTKDEALAWARRRLG